MKVRREILIIFSMILLLVLPATSLGKEIKWVLERPVIPVLVKKPASPVLKVTLIRADNQPYAIQQIDLDLLGSTDVADVVSVAIYGTQENGLIDTSRLLYKSLPAARKISFTDKVQVNQDSLSFWVAVTLKDTVSLDHRIQLNCNRIKTTKGNLKISEKGSKPLRVGVAVRQKGQDGCVSSRIPGLATSNQGTLLAIFDARYDYSRDLQGNIDIALHRSTDKGLTWQPVQTVLDMGEWGSLPQKYNGVSDACILVDKNTGDIYVAGLWMHGLLDKDGKWIEGLDESSTVWTHQWKGKGSQPGTGLKETCQFMIAKSTDDGLSWSFPDNITAKTKHPEWWLFAPAPGQGITLKDGTLVFPTQGRDEKGLPFSNITYSKDHGKTWVTSNSAYQDVTECSVVQLNDGALMLNMRDNRNRGHKEVNGRRICTTTDLGASWKEHPTSRKALVEPTCMARVWMRKDRKCLHTPTRNWMWTMKTASSSTRARMRIPGSLPTLPLRPIRWKRRIIWNSAMQRISTTCRAGMKEIMLIGMLPPSQRTMIRQLWKMSLNFSSRKICLRQNKRHMRTRSCQAVRMAILR